MSAAFKVAPVELKISPVSCPSVLLKTVTQPFPSQSSEALSAIGFEVHSATLYIFVENLVGVMGQEPELVLQSFPVLPSFSPGPAKTDGALAKDAIDKAVDKSSFFIVRWLIIVIKKIN